MSDPLSKVLGDYDEFIGRVHKALCDHGLNPLERKYELDHICYRCETTIQYQLLLKRLVPEFGTLLIESMIGGRPIGTVVLHDPIVSRGYQVCAVEVPCPKSGRPYSQGLEHVEFVIGQVMDGFHHTIALQRFVTQCKDENLPLADLFDYSALDKETNADVSVNFVEEGFVVKFHQRPLLEVCRAELKDGDFEEVPEGYFEQSLKVKVHESNL